MKRQLQEMKCKKVRAVFSTPRCNVSKEHPASVQINSCATDKWHCNQQQCFKKGTHFETVITTVTVDEISDKTKVLGEFIVHSVLLDCFTAELHE